MHHPRYFSNYIVGSVAAIGLFIMLAIPQVAYADGTISVNTDIDEFGTGANCSLREAIQSANSDSDFGGCTRTDTFPYTIDLTAGEFTLALTGAGEDVNATGDLDISTALTIAGAGAGDTIIQAGTTPSAAIDRVIHILSGAVVTMTDVTIRNGTTPTDSNGGGIANMGGTLTLFNSVVRDNTALGDGPGEGGGGIFNAVNSSLTLSATNLLNNSAIITLGNGGGILTAPGSTLVITGGRIENNAAARAGGGIENNGGAATLTNITLDDNTTGLNGGGLHISGAGVVSMTGGTASNNTAGKEGGALWNSGPGQLTVDDVTIEENTASGDDADQGGGGLFSDGGKLIVRNSTINNNNANGISGSGGGILIVPGSALTVTNSTVAENTAMRAGGGIEVAANLTSTAVARLDGVNLIQNETGSNPGNGGALHITGPGSVTVNGGDVISNTASAEGGGLWNSVSGTLTVDGTTLRGNVASGVAADQGGGALFSDGGKLIVRNSTISNNSADGTAGSGGGILVVPGSILTVTNSTLSENTAVRAGGGIEVNATVTKTVSAALTDVDLRQNATGSNPGNGGALHITGPGSVTVVASHITSNTASAEGGGLWNSASGTLIVDKSTLSGNSATGAAADHGGGGLYNDGGALTVSNSTISGNSAQSTGGGILNANGTTAVINVTIYENSAANGAGGINSAAGTTTLANSIVAHKTSSGADCSGVTANGANLDSDGSCQATITADPKLGPLQSNGGAAPIHELLADSPAINAGDNAVCAAAPINNVDQGGQVRPVGAACDLGAYERFGIRLFAPLIAQQ